MKPSLVNDDALDLREERMRSELDEELFGEAVLRLVDGMDYSQQVEFFGLIRTSVARLVKRAALGAQADLEADQADYR